MANRIKNALVTGATSGIGREICKVLIDNGYFVYGAGRNFEKIHFTDCFKAVKLDLTDRVQLIKTVKEIRKNGIELLVNCAGVGYFGLHEEISPDKIHEMIAVNVEAPLIITSLLLRELKASCGRIINISSAEAKKASPHGAAYGASKAAITHFSNSIFDEARKWGVKVCTVHPEMTRTDFYERTDFEPAFGNDFAIDPTEIARCVRLAVQAEDVVRDITVFPQKHRIVRKQTN